MSDRIDIRHASALDCVLEPMSWDWAEREQARIAAHWAKLAAAKPEAFDGQVLMLQRGAVEDGIFRGACFQTSYSRLMAWQDFGFPDPGVRNVFAMAVLRSADGAFILGEMGQGTTNAGRIYFPAGTPDLSDLRGERVDIEGSALRELSEETGLGASDVEIGEGWRIVFAGPRVACMRMFRTRDNADRVVARIHDFLARESKPELARMHVVRSPADFDVARMPDFARAFMERLFGE